MSKIYLNNFRAVARAIAAGRTVWCLETDEGWCREGGCALNSARRTARRILRYWALDEEAHTFFIWDE